MPKLGRENLERAAKKLRPVLNSQPTPAGTTDHGSLAGLSDDDHTQYVHLSAARTITAQHTFAPTTPQPPFVLGANAQGQLVTGLNADQVDGMDASDLVPATRQVIAGNGLTGGGPLSADVTLDVASSTLDVTANSVDLPTPGTISAQSANSATAPHTHAVDASSNPGAAEKLLKSTPSGGLTLESLTVNGAVNVGQDLTVGANVLFVNQSQANVGINTAPDPQFALDVNGPARATWFIGPHALQISDALLIAHFDGPGPMNQDFTGSAHGHMGQVPSVSGGVYYWPGKFGKAIVVSEGTTNELVNPSFEVDLSGWTLSQGGTGGTLSRDATTSVVGSYSLKIMKGTSWTQAISDTIALADGESVTISAWLKTDGSGDVVIEVRDTTNTVTRAASSPVSSTEWTYVYASWTNTTGTTVNVRMQISLSQATGASVAWADACQMERKSYPAAYCDGDLPGHTWSGAPHSSTSSRSGGGITYQADGNVNADEGTIAVWGYVGPGTQVAGKYSTLILVVEDPAVAQNRIYVHWSTNVYLARFYDGSGNATFLSGPSSLSPGWHHFAVTWDKKTSSAAFYVDGLLVASSSSATLPAQLSGATIYVGHSPAAWGSQWWNEKIDDLIMVERAFSADEIRAIYESNAPVFAETSTWYFRAGTKALAWGDEEGLWVRDQAGNEVLGVSGVDGKSWGGFTLDSGDVLIGRNGNGYVLWDHSAAKLRLSGSLEASSVDGDVTISAGAIKAGKVEIRSTGIEIIQDQFASWLRWLSASGGAEIASFTAQISSNVAKLWQNVQGTSTATPDAEFQLNIDNFSATKNVRFYADTANQLAYIRVNGAGINISDVSGVYVSSDHGLAPPNSATAPSKKTTGSLWWDPSVNKLKAWTGSSWVIVGP